MPSAYSLDLRWLVIYKLEFLGHSEQQVSAALHVGRSFIS